MPILRWIYSIVLPLTAAACSGGEPSAIEAPLPPEAVWRGASESLAVGKGDPWSTPAEQTDLTDSPDYAVTIAWLKRLTAASPMLKMVSIGKSPEGRTLWLVVASRDGAGGPEKLRSGGRPTLFAQAGIHSGEIDGKDAGMMLLRDMTVRGTKARLLERANFLFLPVFNVDGHERRSRWGRINQRGPKHQGWRTNARNLNLNRDYGKLDTPEMRAVVKVLDRWPIDLYLDIHVTDGADYQYDITYGWNGPHAYSPSIAAWMDRVLRPALDRDLTRMGHVPGPLVFQRNQADPTKGISKWTSGARYSHGYGDLRHIPSVLVENHSLKSFRRRVLGTYVLLESCMNLLADQGAVVCKAIAADRARRRDPVPLSWKVPDKRPALIDFKTIESETVRSNVSGGRYVRWNAEPKKVKVPVLAATAVDQSVRRPAAYWIPPAWPEVIRRLRTHGVRMTRLSEPKTVEVEVYRLADVQLADMPYEGHMQIKAVELHAQRRRMTFPRGSARIATDQPLGDLAVVMLEPGSAESFFRWGFMLEVLSRTEYAEPYVMEPLAQKMLNSDPELRGEFERRLRSDPAFRDSPRRRLDFFYRRTPYYDRRHLLYPIARETK